MRPRAMPIADLIVLGKPPANVVEGGGSRVAQLVTRLEALPARITFVDPLPLASGRTFVPAALRDGLAMTVARPGRKVAVSLGYSAAPSVLRLLSRRCALAYLDVPDEPRRQYRDLQFAIGEQLDVEGKGRLLDASVAAFECVGFATAGLARLFPSRPGHIVVPNSADPSYFTPAPAPDAPTVGLVGSTTRARGADLLIDACARARRDLPGLRLRLALHDTGGWGNLTELKERHGSTDWISFESVAYPELPAFLRGVAVCAIPHPRTEYTDLALPMKLFDYMAAARPVVTTDCPATAEVVLRHDAGIVCTADPDDMARALAELLTDRDRAACLGHNGRRAVETEHNWDRALAQPIHAVRRRLGA